MLEQEEALKHSGNQLLNEWKALFPTINSCAYSESVIYSKEKADSAKIGILILKTAPPKLKNAEKDKIREWITNRIPGKRTEVYFD